MMMMATYLMVLMARLARGCFTAYASSSQMVFILQASFSISM